MNTLPERIATIALLGFGEAGSALARGFCQPGGWRDATPPEANRPRRLIAIDTELGLGARGAALAQAAAALDLPIGATYDAALGEADVVFSAVPGEQARAAAAAAAPLLQRGAFYLDLCTITGKMAEANAALIADAGGRYVDVAVMGTFFGHGHRAPMLLAGADAAPLAEWLRPFGFEISVLSERAGQASAVKMMRSVLIKGIEALAVEALVGAKRAGILDELLACLGDVDKVPFRQYVTTILETHLVHARRRLEEMEMVAKTLGEVGVPPLMSNAIIANHARTVAAQVAPADGKVPPLAEALALLSDKVVKGPAAGRN